MTSLALTHLLFLGFALSGGNHLARGVLAQLPNEAIRPGTRSAGRFIGYGERALIYLAVIGDLAWLGAVVVALKTLVRFPELQARSLQGSTDTGAEDTSPAADPGSFAEYYLVGTLMSVAWAVLIGLVARAVAGSGAGLGLALLIAVAFAWRWWSAPVSSIDTP